MKVCGNRLLEVGLDPEGYRSLVPAKLLSHLHTADGVESYPNCSEPYEIEYFSCTVPL